MYVKRGTHIYSKKNRINCHFLPTMIAVATPKCQNVSKETCLYEKRHVYTQRDHESKQTYIHGKHLTNETHLYEKKHIYTKRDIFTRKETMCQNRLIRTKKIMKMRHVYAKRHVQKRPCIYSKETYTYMKKDV